jgi:hypothetical protein
MANILTGSQKNALHWAAVTLGFKADRERNGAPLTADELSVFEQYQANARDHGLTDDDIRAYDTTLGQG